MAKEMDNHDLLYNHYIQKTPISAVAEAMSPSKLPDTVTLDELKKMTSYKRSQFALIFFYDGKHKHNDMLLNVDTIHSITEFSAMDDEMPLAIVVNKRHLPLFIDRGYDRVMETHSSEVKFFINKNYDKAIRELSGINYKHQVLESEDSNLSVDMYACICNFYN